MNENSEKKSSLPLQPPLPTVSPRLITQIYESTQNEVEIERKSYLNEFTSSIIYEKIEDDFEDDDETDESSTLTQAKQEFKERNTYSSLDSFENYSPNKFPTSFGLNSILITPLNKDYKTPQDIDVKILTPMQINSILNSTKSQPNLSRSKTVDFSNTYRHENSIKRQKYSEEIFTEQPQSTCISTECQTDFKLDPFVTKSIPCLSELESIDIYYTDVDSSFQFLVDEQFQSDDSVQIELYKRDAKGKRRPLPADRLVCSSTQTVVSIKPDTNRSTQTSPTLLRNYFLNEQTNKSNSSTSELILKPFLKENDKDETIHKIETKEESISDEDEASFQTPIIQPSIEIKYAEIYKNVNVENELDELKDSQSSSSSIGKKEEAQIESNSNSYPTSDDSIDDIEPLEPKVETYKVEIHQPIVDKIASVTKNETRFIEQLEQETSNEYDLDKFLKRKPFVLDCDQRALEPNWLTTMKKSISFNDELDIIEPSDKSTTATTSTSNIATLSHTQIDEISDTKIDSCSKIITQDAKEKQEQEEFQRIVSNNWDNIPVKPYNSSLLTKPQLDASLKRKLEHFDLKEVAGKKEPKHADTRNTSNKAGVSTSSSFKIRLRANGFDVSEDLKPTSQVSKIHVRPLSPPKRPPPPLPQNPPKYILAQTEVIKDRNDSDVDLNRSLSPPHRPPPPVPVYPIEEKPFKKDLMENSKDNLISSSLIITSVLDRSPSPPRRPPPPIPITPPRVYQKFEKIESNSDHESSINNEDLNSKENKAPLIVDCYEEIQEALTITETSIVNTTTIIRKPPTEIVLSEPITMKSNKSSERTELKEDSNKPLENNFNTIKDDEEPNKLRESLTSSSRLILTDELDENQFEINFDEYKEDSKHENEEITKQEDSSFEKQKRIITESSRINLSDDENKFDIEIDEYSEKDEKSSSKIHLVKETTFIIEEHVIDNYTSSYEEIKNSTNQNKIIYEYIEKSLIPENHNDKLVYGQLLDETYVHFPHETNRRFIVLPDNWRESDELPYICEEDIDFTQWEIYQEEETNRSYLIDESSGQKYYIVPSDRLLANPTYETITQKETVTYRTEYSESSVRSTSSEEKNEVKYEENVLTLESRSRNLSTSSRLNVSDDLEKFEIDLREYDEQDVTNEKDLELINKNGDMRKSSVSLSKLVIDDDSEKFTVDVDLDAYEEVAQEENQQPLSRVFGFQRNMNVDDNRYKTKPLKLYKSWNNLNDVLDQVGDGSDQDEKYSTDADVEENDENEAPRRQLNENSLVFDEDNQLRLAPKNYDAEIFHVSVSSVMPPAGLFDLNQKSLATYTEVHDYNDKNTEITGVNPFKKIDYLPNTLKKKILMKKANLADKAISFGSLNSDISQLDAKLRNRAKYQSGTSIPDSASVLTEISTDNISIDSKQPLTKMQKLMVLLAEEEYDKVKRRIEIRSKRVPEILKQLETAKSKERKKLEDELHRLMRKALQDEEFIKKYNNKSQSESSLLEEARPTKKTIPSPRTSVGARESGYSSDESGYSMRKNRFNSYESMAKLEVLTDDINLSNSDTESNANKVLVRRLSNEQSINQNTPIVLTRAPVVQSQFISGPLKLSNETTDNRNRETISSNQSSSGDGQQTPTSRSNIISNVLPNILRNQRDEDEDDERRKRDNNQKPNDNQSQSSILRIEYINEDELEENYTEIYDVKVDPLTGESIIFDFEKKIKYIIVKKPQQIQVFDQLEYRYADRSWLDELESTNVRISSVNGEFYVQDDQNRRWIILPDNWRESDVYPYVSINDVDSQEWTVYEDDESGRQYIVDDKTGRRYYLVSDLTENDFILFMSHFQAEKTQKSPTKSQPLSYQYIQKNQIERLDIKLKIDPISGETYFDDPNKKDLRWIVLPNDWKESELCHYINEEDVDLSDYKIYSENGSNRRYIVDDESGVKYYMVPRPDENLLQRLKAQGKSFIRDQLEFDPNNISSFIPKSISKRNQIADSSVLKSNDGYQVKPKSILRVKDESKKEILQVCYVTEDELNDIDLSDIELKEDPVTGEPYIMDRFNKNKKWIIIPSDWKESETSPYISEDDIKFLKWEGNVLFEEGSNRKYINDPESGVKFFIVPEEIDFRESFKYQWSAINALVPKIRTKKDDSLNNPEVRTNRSRQFEKSNRLKQQFIAKRQAALLTGPKRFSYKYRDKIVDPRILPRSPRPLHHLLLDNQDLLRELKGIPDDLFSESDKENGSLFLDKPDKNDPTYQEIGEGGSLDRRKLNEIEIYGYGKQPKFRRSASNDPYTRRNQLDDQIYQEISDTQSEFDPKFLNGILTENFREHKIYKRTSRGDIRSAKSLQLQEQILATPRSQKSKWTESLNRSDKMKPRIILINDKEKILSADKNCKVYVQYYYDYDSVLGADPAYLLMLPNRGPTNPTRPLQVTPKQLVNEKSNIALREAPVFVYHSNGNAYFENLAQYLAGEHAKLSPKTVRKMLQFSNMNEFEKYLESKITREQAERISKLSGDTAVELESLKRELLKTISNKNKKTFYHPNCEYDSLRQPGSTTQMKPNETQDVDIDGVILRSTFVNLRPTGVQRIPQEELQAPLNQQKPIDTKKPSSLKASILAKNQSIDKNKTKPLLPQDQSNNLLNKIGRLKV